MPIKGIVYIFLIALILGYVFRNEIYKYIKKNFLNKK